MNPFVGLAENRQRDHAPGVITLVTVGLLYATAGTVLAAWEPGGLLEWLKWILVGIVAWLGYLYLFAGVRLYRDRHGWAGAARRRQELGLTEGVFLTAFYGSLAYVVFAVADSARSWRWAWWTLLGFLAIGAIGGVMVLTTSLVRTWQRRQVHRKRQKALAAARSKIDRAIAHVVRELPESQWGSETRQEIVKAAKKHLDLDGLEYEADRATLVAELEEKVDDHTAPSKQVVRMAEDAIQGFVPRIPRGAIRLVNRLRFNAYVAWKNHLVPAVVEPGQIGKWSVFAERWPDLAWAVALDPAMLGRLEEDAAHGGTGEIGKLPAGCVPQQKELCGFLNSQPKMGDVAATLVHLERDRSSGRGAPPAEPSRITAPPEETEEILLTGDSRRRQPA